jgi:hypothetical protein
METDSPGSAARRRPPGRSPLPAGIEAELGESSSSPAEVAGAADFVPLDIPLTQSSAVSAPRERSSAEPLYPPSRESSPSRETPIPGPALSLRSGGAHGGVSFSDPDSPSAAAIFDVPDAYPTPVAFDVYRVEPSHYKGVPIAGFWRRVEAPFGIVDLQQRQGGGLYRVTRLERGRRVQESSVRIGVIPPRVDDFPGASREDVARFDAGNSSSSLAATVELAVARAIGAREAAAVGARKYEDDVKGSIERAEQIVALFDRLRGKNERGGSFLRDIPDVFWKQAGSALQSAVSYFTGKKSAPAASRAGTLPAPSSSPPLAASGDDAPAPITASDGGPPIDYPALEGVIREAGRSILSHVETGAPKLVVEAERLVDSTPGIDALLVPSNRSVITSFLLRAIGEAVAADEKASPGKRAPADLARLERTLPEAVSVFVTEALDYASADDGGDDSLETDELTGEPLEDEGEGDDDEGDDGAEDE